MIGWIIRPLLALAGVIAAWFVATDAPNFDVVRALISIVILVACLAIAAFWPKRR
jgi:hypothetical protein